MGWNTIIWCALSWLLCTRTVASPRSNSLSFVRSAVETVPEHDPIPAPIRASVESIPLRSLRDEGDERLPLRDAVEKRPIAVIDESLRVNVEDIEGILEEDMDSLRQYYGAANYLNKFQLGNANLQEMQQTPTGPTAQRIIVCYMESLAAYRAPPLAFTAGLVPRSCTHLHYAFAVLHPHTYALMPANEDYDVIKGGYRIATGLKRRKTGLRVMLSVGGDGTDRLFSEMVQEQNRRSNFIDSAVSFLREHDFDGLDIHWLYPGEKDEEEREMFTSLLYELREKMSSYGLLLSTVLPPFRYQIEDGYDLSAVSGAADYVILQAWDMTHGKRDEPPSKAVQHSALHRDPGAASRDQRYDNIEFMVKYILRHGMAPEKLVLGVPLFGRSYTLAGSTLPAPGASISGWGEEGPYTQTKGLLAYFEICIAEREGKGVTGTDDAGNAYAVFGNQWVSYDSQTTIAEKVNTVYVNSYE